MYIVKIKMCIFLKKRKRRVINKYACEVRKKFDREKLDFDNRLILRHLSKSIVDALKGKEKERGNFFCLFLFY